MTSPTVSLLQEVQDLFGVALLDDQATISNNNNNINNQTSVNDNNNQVIYQECINLLQAQAWLGKMSSEGLRGVCWRIFLGILKKRSYGDWYEELKQQNIEYIELKQRVNPSLDKVADDPLSSLGNGGPQSTEWVNYYKKLDMANLIRVDLDRLYMPGISDDYFHDPVRKERLLAVLLVWALKYDKIAYRQGMHELVGTISYVLDTEVKAWKNCGISHKLIQCFSEEYEESNTYWLFERIMKDLVDLYDPIPITNTSESVPQIVDYCTRIQEHFLRQIDPELCDHLENAYIQGQIYGLRWARLLLGREFPLSHKQSLRIWDYMFASCMEDSNNQLSNSTNVVMEELRSAQSSVSSASRVLHQRYGSYSPLMGVLGDFMLAMLLHIREQLVSSDNNEVLGLLMKYPAVEDVTPIMDLADMLRRGVLNCGAHLGPPPPSKNRQKFLKAMNGQRGSGKNDNSNSNSNRGGGDSRSPYSLHSNHPMNSGSSSPNPYSNSSSNSNPSPNPPWLLTNPILPVLNSATFNNMGRKVTEQISAVSSAVKNNNPWKTLDPSYNNSSQVHSHSHSSSPVKSNSLTVGMDPLSDSITVSSRNTDPVTTTSMTKPSQVIVTAKPLSLPLPSNHSHNSSNSGNYTNVKSIPVPIPIQHSSPEKQFREEELDLIDWFLGTTSHRKQSQAKPVDKISSNRQTSKVNVDKNLNSYVSDRLMDIADMLSQSRDETVDSNSNYNSSNNNNNGNTSDNEKSPAEDDLAAEVVLLHEKLAEEKMLRYEAARRLRLLCDILSGHAQFQSYDNNIETTSLTTETIKPTSTRRNSATLPSETTTTDLIQGIRSSPVITEAELKPLSNSSSRRNSVQSIKSEQEQQIYSEVSL